MFAFFPMVKTFTAKNGLPPAPLGGVARSAAAAWLGGWAGAGLALWDLSALKLPSKSG